MMFKKVITHTVFTILILTASSPVMGGKDTNLKDQWQRLSPDEKNVIAGFLPPTYRFINKSFNETICRSYTSLTLPKNITIYSFQNFIKATMELFPNVTKIDMSFNENLKGRDDSMEFGRRGHVISGDLAAKKVVDGLNVNKKITSLIMPTNSVVWSYTESAYLTDILKGTLHLQAMTWKGRTIDPKITNDEVIDFKIKH